ALKVLFKETSFNHYSARALLQNCSRALWASLKLFEGGQLSREEATRSGLILQRVFESTARAMDALPEDSPPEEIPPSFISVTEELKNATEICNLPSHVISRFEYGLLLPHPIVIHPSLDIGVETLQRGLRTIYGCKWNLNTLEATYAETVKALDFVNSSLFARSEDATLKSSAFIRNIEEFHRLYLRHWALTYACQWIAITLIGPYWLNSFKELCKYLSETVARIVGGCFFTSSVNLGLSDDLPSNQTGETYNLDFARVEEAIAHDFTIMADCWRGNINIANQERCRNPRTCKALDDVSQWASQELHSFGDEEGSTFAAKEAWRLAQLTVPGSYEYRALMHTMYELRRRMYGFLEEWEFVPPEVEIRDVLGEGGFATVRSCIWFGGAAAVKTFRQGPVSAKSKKSALTTENMGTYLHRRELEVWYRLGHPNILPFLGACLTGSTPMILTPLSKNGNARSYRYTYPNADWLKILAQIASGVNFLHTEAKIVHGDLKGANILISSQASPQIADFGLAKMMENIYGHREVVGGTAQWMAPELLDRSGFLTYASDIYALGMTFYELWYNKDPFELLEPDLVQEMVLEEELRPEREASPVIRDELWSLIEACWPTDRQARLTSADVMDRFKAVSDDLTVEEITEAMGNADIGLSSLPDTNDIPYDQEQHSVENLPCTHLHEPAMFPERDPFPFVSSRHLVSFAVQAQRIKYQYVTQMGHFHCETSQSGIPKHGKMLHPLERVVFRIQSVTYPHDTRWEKEWDFPGVCRMEAALLRRSEDEEAKWIELPEGSTTLLDVDLRCDASIAHQIELDGNSPVIRSAEAGDKVGLRVLVDSGYQCRIDYAEIEMHVRLADEGISGEK
ncbi:hypothetical protein FRB90_002989, partial [Tulasnella sp. 427]